MLQLRGFPQYVPRDITASVSLKQKLLHDNLLSILN